MIRYVNKTEFRTKIGVLYCLWKDRADGITVLFLGCKKESFRKYIEKIEDNFSGSDNFSFINKESKDIENKIDRYLDGKIRSLDFKVEFLAGTQFQKKNMEYRYLHTVRKNYKLQEVGQSCWL